MNNKLDHLLVVSSFIWWLRGEYSTEEKL